MTRVRTIGCERDESEGRQVGCRVFCPPFRLVADVAVRETTWASGGETEEEEDDEDGGGRGNDDGA
jgi:hypothetical protein